MNWWSCRWRSSCSCIQPDITPEESARERNAAGCRVRARRRIYLALGVRIQGQTELAPLLRAAMKLEAK